jgi:hypothetical protein
MLAVPDNGKVMVYEGYKGRLYVTKHSPDADMAHVNGTLVTLPLTFRQREDFKRAPLAIPTKIRVAWSDTVVQCDAWSKEKLLASVTTVDPLEPAPLDFKVVLRDMNNKLLHAELLSGRFAGETVRIQSFDPFPTLSAAFACAGVYNIEPGAKIEKFYAVQTGPHHFVIGGKPPVYSAFSA